MENRNHRVPAEAWIIALIIVASAAGAAAAIFA